MADQETINEMVNRGNEAMGRGVILPQHRQSVIDALVAEVKRLHVIIENQKKSPPPTTEGPAAQYVQAADGLSPYEAYWTGWNDCADATMQITWWSCLKRSIAGLKHKTPIRRAAERVCGFDWSGNDEDAVAAIDELRDLLTGDQQ